ncbi:MAG TPA: NAD-dependent DNA ligase LigA, partial [Phycisphaerae bacterium]
AEGMLKVVEEWRERRFELPYMADGLVFKVDSFAQRDVLGRTSRYPRWCIAYKYEAEQGESKVLNIDFMIGKLGTITPRAVMEPVLLSGTTVRHATLHNFDQAERLDVRVGDTVVVEKAGEIIPQVVRVVLEKRPAKTVKLKPPTKCPACGGQVEKDEGGVYIRCISPKCPAQLKERLTHFCGRHQMDIEGCGHAVVGQLVDLELVRDYADLYQLKTRRDALLGLKFEQQRKNEDGTVKVSPVRFGDKRTDALLAGIEKSKQQPLARLLTGLNIRHVGASTAELLADHFGDMHALMSVSEDELMAVEGIGPETAKSLRHAFDDEAWKDVLRRLDKAGVNMTQPRRAKAVGPLAGKTVVVTGTLDSMKRGAVQDLIKKLGGKAAGSVSKSTDLVVYGSDPGSKLDRARELGVQTLNEQEFLKLVKE